MSRPSSSSLLNETKKKKKGKAKKIEYAEESGMHMLKNPQQQAKPPLPWQKSTEIASMFDYGVAPKGLLTFLGSLYKGGVKTTPRTLVYRFERQTARKNISSFQKHCVLDLENRILYQEASDSFILDLNVIFHGK